MYGVLSFSWERVKRKPSLEEYVLVIPSHTSASVALHVLKKTFVGFMYDFHIFILSDLLIFAGILNFSLALPFRAAKIKY